VFRNLWRHAFPGFRLGAMAFGAFVVVETAYKIVAPDASHHHGSAYAIGLGDGWTKVHPGAVPSKVDAEDDDE